MYLTEEQLAAIKEALNVQRDAILYKSQSWIEDDFEPEVKGDEADIAFAPVSRLSG